MPLPASESTIVRYLAFLSQKTGRSGLGLASSTIQSHLSSLRSMHIYHGYDIPPVNTARVALIKKAISRSSAPPRQKSPIEYTLFCYMWDSLPNEYNSLVTRAIWALSFYATLRGAEYTLILGKNGTMLQAPPKLSAVRFGVLLDKKYLIFSVPSSKTSVHPFYRLVGCSQTQVCSLCSMWSYLQARSRHAYLEPDMPLFVWADGSIVQKDHVNKIIKSTISKLGLDPNLYSTHSFRAGSVSEGSKCLMDWQLQAMGGWSSNMHFSYVRNQGAQLIDIAKKLAAPK